MKVTLKDLTVLALAVCGGLSNINWFEVPYWVYIILAGIYVGSRLVSRDIEIVLFRGGGISHPTKSERGGGISHPTKK